jgi:hypothetical protein
VLQRLQRVEAGAVAWLGHGDVVTPPVQWLVSFSSLRPFVGGLRGNVKIARRSVVSR